MRVKLCKYQLTPKIHLFWANLPVYNFRTVQLGSKQDRLEWITELSLQNKLIIVKHDELNRRRKPGNVWKCSLFSVSEWATCYVVHCKREYISFTRCISWKCSYRHCSSQGDLTSSTIETPVYLPCNHRSLRRRYSAASLRYPFNISHKRKQGFL